MSYWLFPSNKKKYDLVRCLNTCDIVDQPKSNNISKGDTVFVYIAEPYGQILFQMEVLDILPLEKIDLDQWTRFAPYRSSPPKGSWMRMKLVKRAPEGFKPLQYHTLYDNDISVVGLVYPLSRAKVSYLLNAFNTIDNQK